jgi:2-polyprenyl-3-methyl-5-hydroxy-6-metoxy-1,4-benzoquinol methylase
MMSQEQNCSLKDPWAKEEVIDISTVFRSCLGYATTPGWAFIQQVVRRTFSRFDGLRTIELGCGEGKVSLLFSLLGAKTTLVDNSRVQLERAKHVATQFEVEPSILELDLLRLPKSFHGQFDVSMSFGTVEHFFGQDRQRVFHVHRSLLRRGGLTIIWVPNRHGLIFHFGVFLRKLFRRQISRIPEKSFTRNELYQHAKAAELTELRVIGGESLANDFNNFILDLRRLLHLQESHKTFTDMQTAKAALRQGMLRNTASIRPWNSFLSYPLVLIGRHA